MNLKKTSKYLSRRDSVDMGVFFISLVSHYEKMGGYCYNIATGVDRIL